MWLRWVSWLNWLECVDAGLYIQWNQLVTSSAYCWLAYSCVTDRFALMWSILQFYVVNSVFVLCTIITMLRRKHSNKPLWATPRCVLLPTWSSLVGLMTSRQSLTHYTHTGNIGRPSPLKMALSYMEKPSSSLCQKGRGYYSNSTSSIKEPPKPSCLHMDVSSGWA